MDDRQKYSKDDEWRGLSKKMLFNTFPNLKNEPEYLENFSIVGKYFGEYNLYEGVLVPFICRNLRNGNLQVLEKIVNLNKELINSPVIELQNLGFVAILMNVFEFEELELIVPFLDHNSFSELKRAAEYKMNGEVKIQKFMKMRSNKKNNIK